MFSSVVWGGEASEELVSFFLSFFLVSSVVLGGGLIEIVFSSVVWGGGSSKGRTRFLSCFRRRTKRNCVFISCVRRKSKGRTCFFLSQLFHIRPLKLVIIMSAKFICVPKKQHFPLIWMKIPNVCFIYLPLFLETLHSWCYSGETNVKWCKFVIATWLLRNLWKTVLH